MGFLSLCMLVVALFDAGAGVRYKRDESTYKVVTLEENPFVYIKDGAEGNDKYTGFIPELLKQIAKDEGFEYVISTVADKKYGTKNGESWNGMIGELVRKEADVAAAPMTISSERESVIDFSDPFASTGISAVFLKTKPLEGGVDALGNQTKVKYGTVKDGYTQNVFKDSTDTVYKKMYEAMQAEPSVLVDAVQKGIDKVRSSDGKYVFIMEEYMADYWVNMKECDLQKETLKRISKANYAFATQQNSDLTAKLNSGLKKLKQSKFMDDLRGRWFLKECSGEAEPESSGSVSPVFSVASIVSTVVLAVYL